MKHLVCQTLVMAQVTVLLYFVILAAIASTYHAQVNQCEYVIMIHTGPTKGPTDKLKPLIEAVGGGNINTTNLVKNWGDMGKGHTYFLPNSSDRFKYNGPCFNGRFCYFQLRGKKGELNPHWYVHNITVTTKGEGIDRVRVFFSGGIEIDYLYSPPLNDGECP